MRLCALRLVAAALCFSGGLLAAGLDDPRPNSTARRGHARAEKGDRYARPGRVPADSSVQPGLHVNDAVVSRWLAEWQRRLRLQDWKIEARLVRSSELKPDTLGNVKWDREKKTATIRVLDPQDYDLPASQIAGDIENTVVHELVHVRLCALANEHRDPKVEEGVVNPIVDALLESVRRGELASNLNR